MKKDCLNCKFKSFATSTLSPQQLLVMQDSCSSSIFQKGEIIFKEGALSLNIAYIRTGLVKVHMHGDSNTERIIKIIKAPNYLGIPTTIGDKINHYSVTALEETEVCFIDINTFKKLLLTNENFAYQIIVDLCKKELENHKICLNKIQKHTPGLLADAILNFAINIYNANEFELPITRQELAELIGTTRENISRTLSEFQKDKLIKIKNKTIKILDFKRLKTISGVG